MEELVENLDTARELVTVDLSCVKSQYAPGVGLPSPAMGFTESQINEIARKVGTDPTNRVFAVSEYNPAIEKYRTGTLLQYLFSSFLFGIAEQQS